MKSASFFLRRTILIASFCLAVAGCEVGPDYEPPQSSLPLDWISEQSSSKGEIDQRWWENFNDPILTQLIDKASEGNFDLKIAEARIAEARASVSSANAALLPTGDLKGTATREANQLALPGGNSNPFAGLLHKPFNIFQTGFDANWELDLFGGNRRAEEQAETQMQASEASRDDVRVSLRAEVARTYVQIRASQALLAIAKDTIEADDKTRRIAADRFNVGQAARIELTQAEAEQQHVETQLPDLRNQIAQQEFSLDVLLGEQTGHSG